MQKKKISFELKFILLLPYFKYKGISAQMQRKKGSKAKFPFFVKNSIQKMFSYFMYQL